MPNKTFVRVSGLLFTLSGLLYVATSVFIGDRAFYAWLGLSATVLLGLSMWGIYDFLRREANETSLKLGVSAMLVGLIFLVGIYTTAYLGNSVDNATSATGPIQDTLEAILLAVNLVTILIGGFLTYGVSIALIAFSGLRTSIVPKWISWVGLAGGIYSLLWVGWGWLFGPHNIFILLPGVLLVYLWQISLGVVMIRYRESA